MVEVDVPIVICQRQALPKEPLCSRPPYSSGLDVHVRSSARIAPAHGLRSGPGGKCVISITAISVVRRCEMVALAYRGTLSHWPAVPTARDTLYTRA